MQVKELRKSISEAVHDVIIKERKLYHKKYTDGLHEVYQDGIINKGRTWYVVLVLQEHETYETTPYGIREL